MVESIPMLKSRWPVETLRKTMEIEIPETELRDFLKSLPALSPTRVRDVLRGIPIRRVDLSTSEWIAKLPDMTRRGRFLIVDHKGEAVLIYQANG